MKSSLRITLFTLFFCAVMLLGSTLPAAASTRPLPHWVAAMGNAQPQGGSGITPIRRWKP